MMKFFYAPNTCSLASHIALEEAGAEYEAIRIDFTKADQKKPDYLAINPKARVPALVTEQGVLTETPALLVYVAQRYPASKLAPIEDPFALAEVQAFNSYLCSTVHVAHAHRMRGYRWADDEAAFEVDAQEGAAGGRRVFFANRTRHAARAFRHGRYPHGLRLLPVHACAMARSRRRRYRILAEGEGSSPPHIRAA